MTRWTPARVSIGTGSVQDTHRKAIHGGRAWRGVLVGGAVAGRATAFCAADGRSIMRGAVPSIEGHTARRQVARSRYAAVSTLAAAASAGWRGRAWHTVRALAVGDDTDGRRRSVVQPTQQRHYAAVSASSGAAAWSAALRQRVLRGSAYPA